MTETFDPTNFDRLIDLLTQLFESKRSAMNTLLDLRNRAVSLRQSAALGMTEAAITEGLIILL